MQWSGRKQKYCIPLSTSDTSLLKVLMVDIETKYYWMPIKFVSSKIIPVTTTGTIRQKLTEDEN